MLEHETVFCLLKLHRLALSGGCLQLEKAYQQLVVMVLGTSAVAASPYTAIVLYVLLL